MSKIRVGIIGAGKMGELHARVLSDLENVEIKACCDINKEKAEILRKQYGLGQAYSSVEEMLKKTSLDAVFVCTPPSFHREPIIQAIKAGKHVFTEKPLAANFADGQAIVEAAKERDVKLQIGYHWRFEDTVKIFKELQSNGKIGKPVQFLGRYWTSFNESLPAWWTDPEISGGQTVEQVTHMYDLSRYLMGDVKQVYANLATLVHNKPGFAIEDTASVSMLYVDGGVGTIASTCAAVDKAKGLEIHIICTKATIHFNGKKRLEVIYKDNPVTIYDFTYESVTLLPPNPTFRREDEAFINAILNNKDVPIGGEEGLKSLAVTLATVESARMNKPVSPRL